METIWLIPFMVVIGAIIGGLTNSLAIKMLFRPYRAMYWGQFRLPFTPGLIPKRQHELARQLGQTVVNHLLTPDGLKKKIKEHSFQKQLEVWTIKEVKKFLETGITFQGLLSRLNISITEEQIKEKSRSYLKAMWKKLRQEYDEQELHDVIPEHVKQRTSKLIPNLSEHILNQLDDYLSSLEGKETLGSIAEEFLENQGFLGNMVSSFLGKDGLSEKIQPAISSYLQSPSAKALVSGLLENELDKLLHKKVKDIESWIDFDEIGNGLILKVTEAIPYRQWMQTPIREVAASIQEPLEKQWIPNIISVFIAYITNKVDNILQNLHIHEIVQDEVEQFDVIRLERMVLEISRREFKMITYLGALIGGAIGFVQGILVLLIR
ncbi:MAG: DUF445 family protein [Bacillaceae bacterium]|nr:DUF445 family protein [Bacillaceae bacterium]